MKKVLIVLVLMLSTSIILMSCKEDKKDSKEETEMQQDSAADKADMAMNDSVYQCPMDCEDGKTYDEEGKCPVCKMDLKKVEKKEEE